MDDALTKAREKARRLVNADGEQWRDLPDAELTLLKDAL
jgi:hypothetical protein